MSDLAYTPPLGTGDTADYDRAIRRWTREMRWRRAFGMATTAFGSLFCYLVALAMLIGRLFGG